MTWLDDLTRSAQEQLTDRVRDSLYARGVSDEQMALYKIGYLNRELPAADYSELFLEWSGQGSRLGDVIVLPLTNAIGVIRGLQFRRVSREPTNSRRSPYMDFFEQPQDEAVLFGLGQAMPHIWKSQSVYLVEGAFDLFPIQRVFPGVLATLTAKVPDSLDRLLRRLVHRIWLGWDADPTGRKNTLLFSKTHGRDFDVRGILYPQVQMVGTDKLTKDPGELWETWGETRFQEHLRTLLKSEQTEF